MREHYIPSSNRHGGPKSSVRGNSAAIRSFLLFSHRFSSFHLSVSLSIPFFLSSFYLPLPFPSTACTIDDERTVQSQPRPVDQTHGYEREGDSRYIETLSRNARENRIPHFLEVKFYSTLLFSSCIK